jgi:hypothetical protein
MNPQLGLFDRHIVTVNAHGLTLDQQFEAFHTENPHVYEHLHTLALNAKRKGLTVGIAMLFEVLRWQYLMTTTDTASDFKLNNNYRAFYSRLLMEQEPELDGYFETRTQRWQTVKQ